MHDDKPTAALKTATGDVPLRAVRITGTLAGACARLSLTQRYENTENVDVEAVYVFPVDEGAALCGFAAKLDDREIKGIVDERAKAFAAYDEAMAEGHGAFLLEQERPNIFTASIGNLKAHRAVEVQLDTVSLLAAEGDALRLLIPTTISPRYAPASADPADVARISPETRDSVPYGLSLELTIEAASPLVAIESPSHPIKVELQGPRATVSLAQDACALDRDFVLLVRAADAHHPSVRAVRDEQGDRFLAVTFVPEMPRESVPVEVVFLLDCSGSMGGDSIEQARRALALCLRTLEEGDRFNLVRFGSRFESLWPAAKAYGEATLAEATAYAEKADADLGGTEILEPLQAIFAEKAQTGSRRIVLLTDGQVSNEDRVIALCQEHRAHTQLFAFGIGAGVSEHLVRGVARASGGVAEFIYPGERIEPKVLRMFRRVKTPRYSTKLDWGAASVDMAPFDCPPVYVGEVFTAFARLKGGEPDSVVLHADAHRWVLPVRLDALELGRDVPVLWARWRIRDLEEGKGLRRGSNQKPAAEDDNRARDAIIELGKRYGLMSSFTSYVAVEYRAEADKSTSQAELRRVPVALTAGWHGQGSVGAKRKRAAPPSPARMAMPMAPPPPAPMAGPMGAPPGMPSGAPAMRTRGGALGGVTKGARAESSLSRESKADAGDFESAAPFDRMLAASAAPSVQGAAIAPEPAPAESPDRLYDLLMTQQADGHFDLSEALRAWLGTHLVSVEAAAATHGSSLVATAVVLFLLERDLGTRRDEWLAAAEKAKRWLGKQSTPFDPKTLPW